MINAQLHPGSARRAVSEAIRTTAAPGRRAAAANVLKNMAGTGGLIVRLTNGLVTGATGTFGGLPTVANSRLEVVSQPSSWGTLAAMAGAGGNMRIEAANKSWWTDAALGLSGTPATLTGNLALGIGLSNRGLYVGWDAALDDGVIPETEPLTLQLIIDEMTTANQVQPANWAITVAGVPPSSTWGVPFDTRGPTTGRAIGGPNQPGQQIRSWGVAGHLPNGPLGDISGLYFCTRGIFGIGLAPSWSGWRQGMFEWGGSNIIYDQMQSSWGFLKTFETNPRGATYGTRFKLWEMGLYDGVAHSYHFYGNNVLTLPAARDAQAIIVGYQYRIEADTPEILAAQLPNANIFCHAGGDEFTGGTNFYDIGFSRFRGRPSVILPSDPRATQWKWSIATNPGLAEWRTPPVPLSAMAVIQNNPPPFGLMTGI